MHTIKGQDAIWAFMYVRGISCIAAFSLFYTQRMFELFLFFTCPLCNRPVFILES